MSKFMKTLAFIALIAGIVASAIIASANPIAKSLYNDYFKSDLVVGTSFNFWVFIAGCTGSLFPFGFLYSIGIIIDLLSKIAGIAKPAKKDYHW